VTSSVRGRSRRRRVPAETPEQPRAERERPSRPPYVRRRLVALGVVVGVLVVGYLVLFTSLFGVRSVEVTGASSISADDVRAAAAIVPGTPLVRLDTDEVRARVARLPKVFSVEVSRSFPSTVEIAIVERAPVAFVAANDGAHLVDGTGLDYQVVKQAPAGLPKLTVPAAKPDDPATRAVVAILAAIPHQLRTQVVAVTAKTGGDVQLSLADGKLVKWGSPDDSARKAAVLAPLLTRPGKVYDVTTADFPTVS
jgi:cell division protein FtsQ